MNLTGYSEDEDHHGKEEAQLIYEFYFYISAICTFATGGIMVAYQFMKLNKIHPNKIIINILFLQFLNSLKYLVTFSTYKIMGDDLNYSPYYLHDFGFMNFNCRIEGLVSYLLFILIVLWNFIWTYDIYLTMCKPLSYSENYVYYYKVFVYFIGFIFSLVVFFPNMQIFTDTTVFICYMKYGVIYNVFINTFIFIVFLLNLYVMIRYTRKSRWEGFVQNRRAIANVISIHRLYVILWSGFQLSSFIFVFFDNIGVKLIHGVIMACSPMIICITFAFSFSLNIKKRKRYYSHLPLIESRSRTLSSEEDLQNTTSKKKTQALIDSLLILNPGSTRRDGQNKLYVNPDEKAFKYENQKGYWEISDNFKEVLRKEVLEYIVKAFDVLFESHRRHAEDTEIAKATMIDLNPRESLSTKKSKRGEDFSENFEFDKNKDKTVYGHPDLLKRVELLTKEDIEMEAKNETTFQVFRNESYILEIDNMTNKDFTNTYELIELAPLLFQNIRKMSKITNGAIKKVFSMKNIKQLEISITQGKGGSFFIRPAHGLGRVLIKSITIPEYNIIKSFLPEYYSHLLMNPNTYLVPILGAYKLRLQKSKDAAPIAFILMRDALDIRRSDLGPHDRMYTFDLKGSLHDRQVLDNPADIFEIDADYDEYKDVVFKDIDFLKSFTKLDITNLQATRIMSQLANDVELLKSNNFMDYSILMYIIIRPYSSVKASVTYTNSLNREKALFQGTLDEIPDAEEGSGSDSEEEKKSEINDNGYDSPRIKITKPKEEENKYSPNSPRRTSPTYYNRTTCKNEVMNLFQGNPDNNDTHPTMAQKRDTSPLKNLAYYENKIRETGLSGDIVPQSPANQKVQNLSTLYISESNVELVNKNKNQSQLLSPIYDGSLLVLKERVNEKLKVFHICENSDINTLKGIEATEKMRGSKLAHMMADRDNSLVMNEYTEKDQYTEKQSNLGNTNEQKIIDSSGLQEQEENLGKDDSSNVTIQLASERSGNSSEEKKAEGEGSYSSLMDNYPQISNPAKNPYYRLSSVLNFDKRMKQLQADKDIAGVLNGLSDPQLEEDKQYQEALEKKLQEIDKKIECEFCNVNYRQNHILEIEGMFDDSASSPSQLQDDIWKGIVQREKIEQLIFDPQLGMVKREIHFGVIDYITTFNLRKRIEEKLKRAFQKQPSAVNPDVYSTRFLDLAKNIFK